MLPKRLILAAAYYRMSSDSQDKSIADQRVEVERYAALHGYKIVREYLDEGISGDATEKRFGFQQMIQDCSSRAFEVVICWDQDRFGRFDPLEAGYWIRPMRQAGVTLVTVGQGVIDWSDFAGRIVWTVQQEGKHAYLSDLSRNTYRGKIRAAKDGAWLTKAPYGYQIVEGRLQPGDPVEIATVQKIFEEYVAGRSIRGIASLLNSEGSRSPRKKPWRLNSVRQILIRPAYLGHSTWNKVSHSKYHEIKDGQIVKKKMQDAGQWRKRGEEDWLIVSNTHAPLVSQELWDRAQKMLESNRKKCTPFPSGGDFRLTGLLFCEHCGMTMRGSRQVGKSGKVYPVVYLCRGNTDHGPSFCLRNTVREDQILDSILDVLENLFTNEATIEAVKEMASETLRKENTKFELDTWDTRQKNLAQELAKLKRRLLEVDSEFLPIVQEEIRTLEAEQRSVEAKINEYQHPKLDRERRILEEVESIASLVNYLREKVYELDAFRVRTLLSNIITRMTIRVRAEPTAKRYRYIFEGGSIYFQKDELWDLIYSCTRTASRSRPSTNR